MNNKQYLINILDKLISEYGYRNWRRGTLVANELKSWENNRMYFGFNEEEDINKKQLTDEINNIDQTARFLKDQIRDKELIKKMKRLREQLKLNKNISMEDENLINRLSNEEPVSEMIKVIIEN